MANIGQFDIVVLNRGEREGLEKGAVLQVSKAGAVVYDRKAGIKSAYLRNKRALSWCFAPQKNWFTPWYCVLRASPKRG